MADRKQTVVSPFHRSAQKMSSLGSSDTKQEHRENSDKEAWENKKLNRK